MSGEPNDLRDLYFGRDDAERDAAEGGLLRAGFLRTAAYDATIKGRKHVIIGRKGAGKSAICRILEASQHHPVVTLVVTPDEISADEIRRFELQGVPGEKAKELIWRYIFAIELAGNIIAHAEAEHPKAKLSSVDRIRKFLVTNDEIGDLGFQERFWRAARKLKSSFSLEVFGIKAGADFEWPSEGVRADSQLRAIEANIKKAIDDLDCDSSHPRTLVLVDKVDDVWSDDPESIAMVIGLLRASQYFSSIFTRDSCVVFLRSDIYDLVRFYDKDKQHGDELRIDWTAGRLGEMVLARACASLGRSITAQYLWQRVFPDLIDGVDSQSYIVSHTLMRPRDMIHLCNLCRETAEQNGHRTITESDVHDAITQYSHWKLEDLATEYQVNYPFLGGLMGIFRDSGYLLMRKGFEIRFTQAAQTLRRRYPEQADTLTPDAIIDILYDIGFLGVRRAQGVVFSYQQPYQVEPTDSEFFIHPCFRSALRATAATVNHYYRPSELTLKVRRSLRGSTGRPEARISPEFALLRSAESSARRILAAASEVNLPSETRGEIIREIRNMLSDTENVESRFRFDGHSVDVVQHLYGVIEFLRDLVDQLERNGFSDKLETRLFVRTIDDVARQLRRQASGQGGSGGGGGGNADS
jgi:hypothetical protein